MILLKAKEWSKILYKHVMRFDDNMQKDVTSQSMNKPVFVEFPYPQIYL